VAHISLTSQVFVGIINGRKLKNQVRWPQMVWCTC